MKGYLIKVSILLINDIDLKNLQQELSSFVNFSMLDNEKLKEVHTNRNMRYKTYSISSLTPIEKNKVYKKGKRYVFEIRTIDIEIARAFKLVLPGKSFKSIVCDSTISEVIQANERIEFLENNTICIITEDNKCYDKRDKDFILNRISRNAIFKYNNATGNDIPLDYDWIDDIDILTLKTTVLEYKKAYMIGHKYRIAIKEDEVSQDIANIVYILGMCEKNSLGFGNCKKIVI